MSEPGNNSAAQFPQHWVDRRSLPPRAEAADGSFVDIAGDDRAAARFRLYQEDACEHPETVIVKRVNSAGNPFFTRYCPHCGVKFGGGHIPRAKAEAEGISAYSEADMEAAAEAYTNLRGSHFDSIVDAAAERALEAREQEREDWRKGYDDYLRSPRWKAKAAKIMERAGGTCEGCLSREATEVHHRTYEHVFEEFAFELIALCSPCHRRIHGKDAV